MLSTDDFYIQFRDCPLAYGKCLGPIWCCRLVSKVIEQIERVFPPIALHHCTIVPLYCTIAPLHCKLVYKVIEQNEMHLHLYLYLYLYCLCLQCICLCRLVSKVIEQIERVFPPIALHCALATLPQCVVVGVVSK